MSDQQPDAQPDEQPDEQTQGPDPADAANPIDGLYQLLGSAQAGIQVRQDEARKDLEAADAERARLEQVKAQAIQDGDTQAYAQAQQQLEQLYEAERMIRASIGEGDEAPQGGPDADTT